MNRNGFRSFVMIVVGMICSNVFSQDYLTAFKNEKDLYGYKNEKGKVKIKPQFEAANDFKYDKKLTSVKSNGKWGYINRDGDVVIPFQYDAVQDMFVTANGKKGLIGENGKFILPPVYASLDYGTRWFIASMDGTHYGFIDSSGNVMIPMEYEQCRAFDGEIIIFKNKEGGYDWKEPTRLAAVKTGGSWGFINRNNVFVIPPIYKDVKDFEISYTWVSVDGIKYGGVSRTNKLIVPFRFTDVGSWKSTGISSATLHGVRGLINSKAIFAGERSRAQEIKLYDSTPPFIQEMITSANKAKKDGYPKEFIQTLTKAYNSGSGLAARLLGYEYDKDTLNKQSSAKAVEWYQKGAAALDFVCMGIISNCYYTGKGLPRNDSAAFDLLKKIAAYAQAYDPELDLDEDEYETVLNALGDLADFYYEGKACAKNYTQSFYWYNLASLLGSDYGSLQVGDAYYKGEGVPKDLIKAAAFFESASYYYDYASYMLGKMYYNGEGVAKNTAEGIKYFKLAALNGHKDSIAFLDRAGIKWK